MFPLLDPSTFSCCIIIWILIYIVRQLFTRGTYYEGKERLDGKVVIVTGANSGIGKESALEFAKRGASVILACRNEARGIEAEKYIRKESGNESVRFRPLDLSSLKSVRHFVNTIKNEETSVYALVNNAGVFWCPFTRTEDGFELNIGVNHLGHFVLTILLLPLLTSSDNDDVTSRVVTVSSLTHGVGKLDFTDLHFERRRYDFARAYSASKLANVLFSQKLSTIMENTRVNTYCVDPGIVKTEIGKTSFLMNSFVYRVLLRPLTWLFMKDAKCGAQTSIYCVCSDALKYKTGQYYVECEQRRPWSNGNDSKMADVLWEESLRLSKLSERDYLEYTGTR